VRKRFAAGVVACAVVLVGTVAVAAMTRGERDVPGADAGGHAEVSVPARSFRISGDAVDVLAPGRSAPINVTFTNPHDNRLTVAHLRVRVRKVDAPNADRRHPCSTRDFAVRQVSARFSVSVPADTSRSLARLGVRRASWPQVRMVSRPVNQDGCKGASLTLAYVGSGSLRR
jgi:hypothetical protein